MSNPTTAIDKIKKLHSAMSIERKDLSLKDLIAQEADKKTGIATLEIVGFASKYVPKYHTENNQGFHTMIYLKDGRKTGGFSGALYEIAQFFYRGAGMDPHSQFNKIDLKEGDYLKIAVSKVELDGGKRSTYNFEIIDGALEHGIEKLGQILESPLLIEG